MFKFKLNHSIQTPLLLCIVILSIAALMLSQYFLREAYQQLAQATSERYAAEPKEFKAKKLIEMNAITSKLLEEATAVGLSPILWTELTMHIRRQKMTRDATNKLLNQIKTQPDNYFQVDKFEIAVEQPEQSLFDAKNSQSDLMVTLQGRSIMRSSKLK